MPKRGNAIRGVTKVLEKHQPLVAFLGHTVGADRQSAGAKIVGFSNNLDKLPVPGVVITIESGDAKGASQEQHEWTLSALLYGRNVYEVADLLEHVEDALLAYRTNQFDPPLPLNSLKPGRHEGFLAETPQGQVLSVALSIRAKYV